MIELIKDLAWKSDIPQTATAEQIEAIKAQLNTDTANVNIPFEVYDEDGDEIIVGEVRKTIDGVKKKKPLYKKAIIITDLQTSSKTNVDIDTTNFLDNNNITVYKFYGNYYAGETTYKQFHNFGYEKVYYNNAYHDYYYTAYYRQSDKKIVIQGDWDGLGYKIDKGIFIFQYTKTTDQWTPV